MIVEGLLAVAAVPIGVLSGVAAARLRQPKRVKPMCTCHHGYGMHTPEGCQSSEDQHVRQYDQHRGETYYVSERVPCACKAYDGPVPDFRLV